MELLTMILSRNCSHHKHFSLSVLINITLINNDYIFPKILILNIKITKLFTLLVIKFSENSSVVTRRKYGRVFPKNGALTRYIIMWEV